MTDGTPDGATLGQARSSPPRSVSIVIPTHDRSDQLAETLDSIAALEAAAVDVEVVVVANACSDSTVSVVTARAPRFAFQLRCVEEPEAGLNIARNRGLASAKSDAIAFLDDDVRVDRGWLAALVGAFSSSAADILAGRVLLDLEGGSSVPLTARVEQLLSKVDHGDEPLELRTRNTLAGANFAFRREVFPTTGGFRADLDRKRQMLLSGGDTELVARARTFGFRVFYVPGMSVHHRIPPSRLQVGYLARLARGRGRTRVAIAAISGSPSGRELLRTGAAQVVAGLGAEIKGALRSRAAERIEGRLLWMQGFGLLGGMAAQARGRGVD